MAIICTNNLTGNDSTGTGATGAPYKTIAKALAGATSGDEIRVAGGQWVTLTGDFTFTNSSVTVNTSVSQVGTVAANDIIAFEDGQYGFDKFHYRITAVTSTTLTLGSAWSGPTQVSSSVFKLNAIHYTATESWANPNTQYRPNGRTNIKVTGGWDSGYTSNANGWTACRAGFLATVPNTAGNVFGDWRQNLFFDKFILSTGGFLGLSVTSTGNDNSFAAGRLSFINSSGNGEFNNVFNRNFGLYNLDESTPVELSVTSSAGFRAYFANAVAANNPTASKQTKVILWASMGAPNNNNGGYDANLNVIFGSRNAGIMGSANKVTAHLRKTYVSSAIAFYGNILNLYTFPYSTQGANISQYFENLYLYCNQDKSVWFLNTPPGCYVQIENMEFVGPGANGKNGTTFAEVGQILVDISQEGKTIESFKPCIAAGYSYGAGATGSYDVKLSSVCQINLSMTQVKDAEGLKTMDPFGNIYFKDFVNGWLRVSSSLICNNLGEDLAPSKVWKVIGVKEKINTPFTATFRLKDDGLNGGWETIGLQYGPGADQIVTATVSLTTSFEDYYITVDPSTIADWNLFSFPMYFGVASGLRNLNSPTNTYTNCFIESVTIS